MTKFLCRLQQYKQALQKGDEAALQLSHLFSGGLPSLQIFHMSHHPHPMQVTRFTHAPPQVCQRAKALTQTLQMWGCFNMDAGQQWFRTAGDQVSCETLFFSSRDANVDAKVAKSDWYRVTSNTLNLYLEFSGRGVGWGASAVKVYLFRKQKRGPGHYHLAGMWMHYLICILIFCDINTRS